jgi:hypothetical protein
MLSALLVVGILLVVIASIFTSCPSGSARGEIRSAGLPDGDFVVRPVDCYKGGHWDFSGVWVIPEMKAYKNRSGFTGGLKIVEDDAGKLDVILENPTRCRIFKCEQRKLAREHCPVFDVVLRSGSLPLRKSGHARIECAFPEGGTLKAAVEFEGCAEVPSGGDD